MNRLDNYRGTTAKDFRGPDHLPRVVAHANNCVCAHTLCVEYHHLELPSRADSAELCENAGAASLSRAHRTPYLTTMAGVSLNSNVTATGRNWPIVKLPTFRGQFRQAQWP